MLKKGIFADKSKTLKERKHFKKGTKRYELHKKAKETLGSGDIRTAVALPEGEDQNEWLATNTVDFFNQVNLLYGSITLFCTEKTCPVMSASPKYEYLWADEVNKKPIKVSAPEYVDKLMEWIQSKLDNEQLFPPTTDVPFPRTFVLEIKQIFKRLFRVYAHIYYSHFEKIVDLGEEAHLNTCFKHYYYFVTEFDLVPRKEMAPLEDLIQNLTGK
jgi:MOB kinase activator 1